MLFSYAIAKDQPIIQYGIDVIITLNILDSEIACNTPNINPEIIMNTYLFGIILFKAPLNTHSSTIGAQITAIGAKYQNGNSNNDGNLS